MSNYDIVEIDNIEEIDTTTKHDINVNELSDNTKPSVNFGGGIELLMNDKRKSSSNNLNKEGSLDIHIDDLNDIENELNNDLELDNSDIKINVDTESMQDNIKIKSNTFNETNINKKDATSFLNIGKATATTGNIDNAWNDDIKPIHNIPAIDPDKAIQEKPKMTQEELLREKFKILKKLEAIEEKGVKLTKKYNMESSLSEMKGEYEMIISEKEKQNGIKFQQKMLMAAITGIEFLNNKFDPFDVKLDGWSEQINENISEYDEIFAELHEKYSSKAKMAPELKLLFQLAGSAIMVHMTNTMFKSAMPGMDDIMRQNPELMQQFTQAAMNSMGSQNPGFGGFMNNVMGGGEQQTQSRPQNVNVGRPPSPIKTRVEKSERYKVSPEQMSRPDLYSSRNEGVEVDNRYGNYSGGRNSPPSRDTRQRPEMRGPSDIGDLLSGLKTKTIQMPAYKSTPNEKPPTPNINTKVNTTSRNDNSSISIQELKEMSTVKMPSRSKKRNETPKTTVSLDI